MDEKENLWAYRKRFEFIRSALVDAFPSVPAGSLRVLDIGCGNGSQLSIPLARAGFQVTGVDSDDASIHRARQLSQGTPTARFLCEPLESVTGGPFDAVILSEVLEHVPNPAELLQAGVRHLKMEGLAFVTTPNGFGEFELDSWLFRFLRMERVMNSLVKNNTKPLGSTDNEASGHIQFFTRQRLHKIFAECGLKVWREAGASLFAGPFAGHSLARSARFVEWNARVTDSLPLALASGWYFALRTNRMHGQ